MPARAVRQVEEAVAVRVLAQDVRDRDDDVGVTAGVEVAAAIAVAAAGSGVGKRGRNGGIELRHRALACRVDAITAGVGAAVDTEEVRGVVAAVRRHVDLERRIQRERRPGRAGRRRDADRPRQANVVGRAVELVRIRQRGGRAHEHPLHADRARLCRIVCRRHRRRKRKHRCAHADRGQHPSSSWMTCVHCTLPRVWTAAFRLPSLAYSAMSHRDADAVACRETRASSSSMIRSNAAAGCAPLSGMPLMKNVGVADTPTSRPCCASRSTAARMLPPSMHVSNCV